MAAKVANGLSAFLVVSVLLGSFVLCCLQCIVRVEQWEENLVHVIVDICRLPLQAQRFLDYSWNHSFLAVRLFLCLRINTCPFLSAW